VSSSTGINRAILIPWLFFVLCLFVLIGRTLYARGAQESLEDHVPEEQTEQTLDLIELVQAEAPPEQIQLIPAIRAAIMQDSLRPGEPVTVGLIADAYDSRNLRAALYDARGRRLMRASFFTFDELPAAQTLKAAILAIPSTALTGQAVVKIENTEADGNVEVIAEIGFIIEERAFVAEEIALDQRNTEIRTVPDPQKTAESDRLWAIISRTGTELYANGDDAFVPPVTSTRRTSFYGDRRVYRYVDGSTDTAIHAGVDYGVPTGTAVSACAPGKVVLAQFRISTGNSVIIEHLPGVYSLYYHMDKLAVAEGALVDTGSLLGESGATGLATGPHLHWEIRVATENTDPDAFTARPILDKGAILARMKAY
jgi:murein DD-endopeptidase MepM/ murein hydrolase activator NlpD